MEVRATVSMNLNRNALGQFISRQERDIRRRKAKEAVDIFDVIAPYGPGPLHWRGSLSISEAGDQILITSSDPVALIKELGARHGKNPAFRSMALALAAVCEGGGLGATTVPAIQRSR